VVFGDFTMGRLYFNENFIFINKNIKPNHGKIVNKPREERNYFDF
jgi:hypothetical protein